VDDDGEVEVFYAAFDLIVVDLLNYDLLQRTRGNDWVVEQKEAEKTNLDRLDVRNDSFQIF
jgi:hypothetical protein